MATMPPRRYSPLPREQTALDFDAPEPEPVEPIPTGTVAEPQPEYSVTTGWIDTAGKRRTWILREPGGEKLAEITTKSGAERLADLLNGVLSVQPGRSR